MADSGGIVGALLERLVLYMVFSHQLLRQVPLRVYLVGHSLFCASLAPDFQDKYFIHYWLTFFSAYGGGLLSAWLLMVPQKAGLILFTENSVGIIWTICWWLINYCPYSFVAELQDRWFVKMFTKACTMYLRSSLMVARVDLAHALFPGVIAAPLILGTIAGSGGRFVSDMLRFGWGQQHAPAEASAPGFVSRSALLGSAGYYLLAYQLRLVNTDIVAAFVVLSLTAHSFASDIADRTLDFSEPIYELFHKVSNIPSPRGGSARHDKRASADPATPVRRSSRLAVKRKLN